jgi:hypothetical protein
MHADIISASRSLRLNLQLDISGKNQETSFRTSVLNCRAHQLINEFFQNYLA